MREEKMTTSSSPSRVLAAVLALTILAVVSFVAWRHRRAVAAGKGHLESDGIAEITGHAPVPSPASLAQRLQGLSNSNRLAALESEVAALRAKGAGPVPADSPPPNPDEDFKKHQEDFTTAIAKHRSEPVDEGWARRTTASLQVALEKMAKDHFKLLGVDCRKESCLATVEWESYARAVSTYGTIVTYPYDVPCGTEMILPVPSDSAAPYRADAVFNCETN